MSPAMIRPFQGQHPRNLQPGVSLCSTPGFAEMSRWDIVLYCLASHNCLLMCGRDSSKNAPKGESIRRMILKIRISGSCLRNCVGWAYLWRLAICHRLLLREWDPCPGSGLSRAGYQRSHFARPLATGCEAFGFICLTQPQIPKWPRKIEQCSSG